MIYRRRTSNQIENTVSEVVFKSDIYNGDTCKFATVKHTHEVSDISDFPSDIVTATAESRISADLISTDIARKTDIYDDNNNAKFAEAGHTHTQFTEDVSMKNLTVSGTLKHGDDNIFDSNNKISSSLMPSDVPKLDSETSKLDASVLPFTISSTASDTDETKAPTLKLLNDSTANRIRFYDVETWDEVQTNWKTYADNSIIYVKEGPTIENNWVASVIFRYNEYRPLIFSINKLDSTYICTRFLIEKTTNFTDWRKIPVMDASDNLTVNGNVIASNIKSDNETRLAAAESNITTLQSHTHTEIKNDLKITGNLTLETGKTLKIGDNTLIDIIYPVGSVFTTSDSAQLPGSLYSGTTWEQITTSITGIYMYKRTA